jgi:hypothetical protein
VQVARGGDVGVAHRTLDEVDVLVAGPRFLSHLAQFTGIRPRDGNNWDSPYDVIGTLALPHTYIKGHPTILSSAVWFVGSNMSKRDMVRNRKSTYQV